MERLKELLASPRFWGLVIAMLMYVLGGYGIVPETVSNPIAYLMTGTVVVGTLDRLGKNIGGWDYLD